MAQSTSRSPITSTPRHKSRVDLHRKSILNRISTVKETTPLRKNDYVTLEKHDDNEERSSRSEELVSRSASHREAGSDRTPHRSSIRFGDNEAREHLQNCHKLFAENKITAKNVWGLKIIDVLAHMVVRKKEANLLIIASTGLDVSAKVYGIRVDDLHSFGMRLASHLMKTQNKQHDRESDNDENENIANKPNNVRKRKAKTLKVGGKKPTIDYDGTSLFAPLKKLQKPQFSIDDKLENGAIENLLTSRLPIHPLGHTFRIFNNEKYRITESDITVQNQNVIELRLPKWQNTKICPSFDKFIVNQDAELFDLTSVVNEVAFDNNGIPIPELDGSIHDPFVADNDIDMTEENEEAIIDHQHNYSQQRIFEIIDTIPEDEREENEYNFNPLIETANGRIMDRLWAGPAHWKVKFIKRSSLRYSGNTVVDQQVCQSNKRKRKKTTIPNGILLNVDDLKTTSLELNNKYKDRKQSALMDMTIKDTIQPQLSYEVVDFEEKIDHLLMKPHTVVNPRTSELMEANGGILNNNNNDSNSSNSHFSLQNNDNPYSDDDDNHEMIENHNNLDNNNEENFENRLVDAPQTINVDYLTYALHAKKINMRKLKGAVWNRLTRNNRIDDNENHVEPLKFSQLYREIPEYIDATMAKELSVALVFNSVLYLTNEKSLVITQKKMNFTDFVISK